MTKRRVYVIWTHSLFQESVRLLLLNRPEVEWLGATSDYVTALDQIAYLRPDTILLEETVASNQSAETLKILEAGAANIRVIRFGLDDNTLRVYHREQTIVVQAEDLLRLIGSE